MPTLSSQPLCSALSPGESHRTSCLVSQKPQKHSGLPGPHVKVRMGHGLPVGPKTPSFWRGGAAHPEPCVLRLEGPQQCPEPWVPVRFLACSQGTLRCQQVHHEAGAASWPGDPGCGCRLSARLGQADSQLTGGCGLFTAYCLQRLPSSFPGLESAPVTPTSTPGAGRLGCTPWAARALRTHPPVHAAF